MAVRVTKEDFDNKVLESNIPVLVDFYSDSCVACKRLAPVLGELEDDYDGKLSVVKVNTNFDEKLSKQYGILSNPTIILFKGGELIARKTGALSFDDLEDWILQYI